MAANNVTIGVSVSGVTTVEKTVEKTVTVPATYQLSKSLIDGGFVALTDSTVGDMTDQYLLDYISVVNDRSKATAAKPILISEVDSIDVGGPATFLAGPWVPGATAAPEKKIRFLRLRKTTVCSNQIPNTIIMASFPSATEFTNTFGFGNKSSTHALQTLYAPRVSLMNASAFTWDSVAFDPDYPWSVLDLGSEDIGLTCDNARLPLGAKTVVLRYKSVPTFTNNAGGKYGLAELVSSGMKELYVADSLVGAYKEALASTGFTNVQSVHSYVYRDHYIGDDWVSGDKGEYGN